MRFPVKRDSRPNVAVPRSDDTGGSDRYSETCLRFDDSGKLDETDGAPENGAPEVVESSAYAVDTELRTSVDENGKPVETVVQRRVRLVGWGRKTKTISMRQLRIGMELGKFINPTPQVDRPKKRSDCLAGGVNEQRPCPFVSCEHHLYLDIEEDRGALRYNFPGIDLEALPDTCVLDIADRGGATLEEVGHAINVTRERVRQIEGAAFRKISDDMLALHSFPEELESGIRKVVGEKTKNA